MTFDAPRQPDIPARLIAMDGFGPVPVTGAMSEQESIEPEEIGEARHRQIMAELDAIREQQEARHEAALAKLAP